MSHPTHPKCPGCGKALFKAFDGPWNGKPAAKVRPADPYDFCRNRKCPRSGSSGIDPKYTTPEEQRRTMGAVFAGRDLDVKSPAASRGMKELTGPGALKRLARSKAKQDASVTKPTELPAVAKARERIREILKQVASGAPPAAVGLVLAIVNQETGNQVSANALIDEFELDKKFGLMKFEPAKPVKASTK